MDSDQGKLFIGGISWETTEDKLNDYFGKYGDVLQSAVMRDKMTGKPRGFGFVVFADPSIIERVLQDAHTIDGRTVEAKRAMSREEQHSTIRSGNTNMTRISGGVGCGGAGGNVRTKKIFVGGLPPTLSEQEFREYFESFGIVTDVVVMYDQNTQRPRGFGFVSFDSEDSVDRVVQKQFHDVGGKAVEVKRALPKDANPSSTSNRSSGGGSYQAYSGSSTNTSSYDNRMEPSRYIQPPVSGAAYNPYGSSGYGGHPYGYGAAANNAGYGGHGGYSTNGAGGYMSGPRSPWNTQAPSGYGTSGYAANTAYGGPGSGNQGYGYGGYGGNDGSYGNQAGYGMSGGRGGGGGGGLIGNSISGGGEQGGGGGFMSGGGYNDGSGNAGYSNAWRADPTQAGGYSTGQVSASGGMIGYGGGYGASQSRQAQQQ